VIARSQAIASIADRRPYSHTAGYLLSYCC